MLHLQSDPTPSHKRRVSAQWQWVIVITTFFSSLYTLKESANLAEQTQTKTTFWIPESYCIYTERSTDSTSILQRKSATTIKTNHGEKSQCPISHAATATATAVSYQFNAQLRREWQRASASSTSRVATANNIYIYISNQRVSPTYTQTKTA